MSISDIKVKIFLMSGFIMNWSPYVLSNLLNLEFLLTFNANFIYYFIKEVDTTIFHYFFYEIKDKIYLKSKT